MDNLTDTPERIGINKLSVSHKNQVGGVGEGIDVET